MDTLNSLTNKRILIAPFLVVTFALVLALVLLNSHFLQTATKRTEQDLIRLAKSGSEMICLLGPRPCLEAFDNLADSFAEDGSFRVTIIDMGGSVLGDSSLSLE